MRSVLAAVRPRLRALFGDEALARLGELVTPLPAFSVSGFECRLNRPRSGIDLSVYVPRAPIAWPPALLRDPQWARVLRMSDTASLMTWMPSVHGAWLELDADGPASPLPSVFLHVEGPPPSPAALLALASRLGVPEPPAAGTLGRCLEALPATGSVHLQIGAMIPRQARNVRLVLHGITARAALDLAADLGWRDGGGTLARTVTRMDALFDRLSLGLELGAAVGDRVAVEGQLLDHRSPSWRRALGWLTEDGLADEAWGSGLLAWPGIERWQTHPDAWPPRVVRNPPGEVRALRRLSHLKVALAADGRREAKLYLLLEQRTMSDLRPDRAGDDAPRPPLPPATARSPATPAPAPYRSRIP